MRRRCCYKRCSEYDINYDEMIKILNKKSAILIDVRSKQEFNEGHFNGAINIPLYNIKHEIFNKVKDLNKNIIVYCASGARSKEAQRILQTLGYKNVYNLINGFD